MKEKKCLKKIIFTEKVFALCLFFLATKLKILVTATKNHYCNTL